jgi:ABC-2 type transport system ATP-binding protein
VSKLVTGGWKGRAMLALEHVRVKYSGRPVLRDVSFCLRPGEIVAYLGANGSGKTTTAKVVTGLLTPGRGRVLWNGVDVSHDLVAFRRRLAYVPETAEVYPFLSGREYLLLCGRLRGLAEAPLQARVDRLLELFGLDHQSDQPLAAYSKGMRQKVLICAALLHDPELLVLDEPLSGLDVTSVLVMKALLRGLSARGRVVFYSTHLLEVAEKLCQRVLILHEGRLVADDSVENLRELRQQPSLEQVFASCVLADSPDATAERILEIVCAQQDGAT